MAEPSNHGMSKRGWNNVEAIMPKIRGAVAERKITNNAKIDLSTAENWLIRSELIDICKESIVQRLEPKHLSYPRGFSGEPDLLDACASFFNEYFHPHVPVLPSHLSTAPGASGCIDALLYNICEAGDGILIPSPYWNGFDFGIRVRSSVNPVLVPLPSFNSNFSGELLPALEDAYRSATCPIRALMITNPHNPLAVCYPKAILEDCLRFCKKYNLHFMSDEVYALSIFSSPDLADARPFVSVLSLDLDEIGADKSRVHMVWSTSKDFGQSGFRMGCAVTQFNEEMAVGLALAANTQTSALSTIFTTSLLTSPKLPSLIALNSRRLSSAYTSLTTFFKENGIPYVPCNAGMYVFAKISPQAETWEDEMKVVTKLKEAGMLVSAGKAYHGPDSEKGWARVGFAVEESELHEAIRRMKTVILEEGREDSINDVETKAPLTPDDLNGLSMKRKVAQLS
ncbi:1-aminocyclopropane-1-carboxylate synthase [Hypoxylon cercidicola]|nr:1-aminocyclopropane-1-carboxylate synthase [Hypoxylon cercidicola]